MNNRSSFNTKCHKFYANDIERIKKIKNGNAKKREFSKFWNNSEFWENVTEAEFRSDVFIHLFSTYFRQGYVTNKSLVKKVISIDPRILIDSLRLSEIFLDDKRLHFHSILDLKNLNLDQINIGLKVMSLLSDKYKILKNKSNELVNILGNEHSIFDVVTYSSLFLANLVSVKANSLDEQKDLQVNLEVISELINKLNTEISDVINHILNNFVVNLEPILFKSWISDVFEEALNSVKDFIEFKINVWETYSFDLNFELKEHNNKIYMESDPSSEKAWFRCDQKLQAESNYWDRKTRFIMGNIIDKKNIGPNDYIEINKEGMMQTSIAKNYFYEFIGIEKIRDINIGKMISIISGYKIHFEKCYLEKIIKGIRTEKPLNMLIQEQYLETIATHKNRLPINIYRNKDEFIEFLRSTQKFTLEKNEWSEIIDIFTLKNKSTLYMTPFIKIGDFYIVIPFLMLLFDVQKGFYQNIHKLLARRKKRKDDVDKLERNIANLFRELGFEVATGIDIWTKKNGKLTDIDIIAYKDNHIFIIENKTTYLKATARDVWNYKHNVLTKAGMQLDKIIDYKNEFSEDFLKLMNDHNISIKSLDKTNFHTYITDTTYEYDKCFFGSHLKLSLHELRIALTDTLFFNYGESTIKTSFYNKFKGATKTEVLNMRFNKELQSQIVKKLVKNFPKYLLYPTGFNVPRLIEIIDKDIVWKYLDVDYPIKLPLNIIYL